MLNKELIKTLLTDLVSKLNLVTREEFTAQNNVLIRTREKLDALEHKLAKISSDPLPSSINNQADKNNS